jgi:hypothetical protein
MNARLWPLDHPYAAVTAADGSYEIKNAPAGVKLRVFAWHEEVGWLSPSGFAGDEAELMAGDNTKDYEVRAPNPD